MRLMNISIKYLYILVVSIILLLLSAMLILSLFAEHRRTLITASEIFRYNSLKIAGELENSSDELTLMARLYTATGNPIYKNYYFHILDIRNGTAPRPDQYSSRYWDSVLGGSQTITKQGELLSFNERLNQINLSSEELNLLELSHERSDDLTALETRAFNAMEGLYQDNNGKYVVRGKPNSALANELVNSKEYLIAKDKIMQPIGKLIDSVDERTNTTFFDLQKTQKQNRIITIIIILFSIVISIFMFILMFRHLRQINQLLEHVENIKLNNYRFRNTINSNNELGILANTLNQMSDSVNNTLKEQQKYADDLKESEARFRFLIDNSPYGVAIADLSGHFVRVNEAFSKYLGYTEKELLSMGYKDITEPKDIPIDERFISQLLNEERPSYTRDKIHIRKDGSKVWINISVSVIKNSKGEIQNLVGQSIDISDRINSENTMLDLSEKTADALNELKKREREEALLNRLNELLQLCMTLKETYPRIILIAQELFPELSGSLAIYNKDTQMMEKKLEWGENKILTDYFSTLDCFAIRKGTANIVDDPNKAVPCEHYTSPPKGAYVGVPLIVLGEIIGVIHMYANEGCSISKYQQRYIFSFSNVIKLALSNIRLLEALHEQSIRDPLTGLFNRRYLNETLPREMQRSARSQKPLCIAMIDIDFFKRFNDSYSHEAGDLVLKYIGELLENHFRGSDLACRYGGEEFLIVIPDADIKFAYERLEMIRNEIKLKKINYQDKVLPSITISIGIAESPKDGVTPEGIVLAADQALYAAKQAGRDRIQIFGEK